MDLESYLRLTRTSVAAVSCTAVSMGYYIATGSFDLWFLLFWVFGYLAHASGFVLNDICDYEYDLKAGKTGRPLVSGRVSISSARRLFSLLYVSATALGMYLSRLSVLSIVFLVVMMVSGFIYDFGRGTKKSHLGHIAVGFFWGSMPLYSYYSVSSIHRVELFLLSFVFLFSVIVINMVAGLRDLKSDPKNLARSLGSEAVADFMFISRKYKMVVFSFIALVAFTIVSIWLRSPGLGSGLLTLGFALVSMYYASRLLSMRMFNIDNFQRVGSLAGIFAYLALLSSMYSLLGVEGVLFYVIAPSIWWIFWNKITYKKSYIAPDPY